VYMSGTGLHDASVHANNGLYIHVHIVLTLRMYMRQPPKLSQSDRWQMATTVRHKLLCGCGANQVTLFLSTVHAKAQSYYTTTRTIILPCLQHMRRLNFTTPHFVQRYIYLHHISSTLDLFTPQLVQRCPPQLCGIMPLHTSFFIFAFEANATLTIQRFLFPP
jgi:hypothetical protein